MSQIQRDHKEISRFRKKLKNNQNKIWIWIQKEMSMDQAIPYLRPSNKKRTIFLSQDSTILTIAVQSLMTWRDNLARLLTKSINNQAYLYYEADFYSLSFSYLSLYISNSTNYLFFCILYEKILIKITGLHYLFKLYFRNYLTVSFLD